VRVDDLGEIEAIETAIGAFLTAVGGLVGSSLITAVRGQNAGSNVSFPFPISSLVGVTFGTGSTNSETVPFFVDFVGRSTGGRRVRLTLFGKSGSLSDYKLTTSESTEVAAALVVLNNATGTFLSIDGLQPFWYPYADVGVNAYWQRQQRQ